jgi:ABC-type sugar transport system permease subunit
LQEFWHVWLPLLAPTLLIAAMFRALDAFRIFDLVYVLTGGGPADSTEVLSTLTYKNLFSALQFGYGSALSTMMFITEIVIAVIFGAVLLRKMREVGQ